MSYQRSGDGKKALKRMWKLLGMQKSNTKWRGLSTLLGVFSVVFVGTILAYSLFAPAKNTGAVVATDNASAGGYALTLSVTPTVDLNLGVVEVPMQTIAQTSLSASTSAPNGYKLYMNMNDSTNALKQQGGASTIASTSGTISNPVALTNGQWGYAIPGDQISVSNGFDDSYGVVQSGYPNGSKFAGVPNNTVNPAQLINETPSSNPEGESDEFDIYYGIMADDTVTVGTYSNSVMFTAVADAAQTAGMTVSPADGSPKGGEAITITSTLFATSTVSADIYMLTDSAYTDVSTTPANISSYSSMQMSCNQTSATPVTYSCTTPANTAGNNYHVYMNVPKYDKRYSAGFIYQDTFWNISTMQDMTPEICASVTAPMSSSVTTIADTKAKYEANPGGVVPQRTLTDSRDTKTYTIRKLADGRCWMTDNLAIANANLTPSDSDVIDNYYLPASSTSGWCTSGTEACYNTANVLSYADAGSAASGHPEYGNYYSWAAATAGTGKYSTTSGDVASSICPKGWRLPKGGSSGEFQALRNVYSSSAFGDDWRNTPLNFAFAGNRYGGSTYSASTDGNYWSSTAYNNNYAYYLKLSSSYVYPAGYYDYKYRGFPVRCIAKETPDFWNIRSMQEMTPALADSVNAPTDSSVTNIASDKATYEAASTGSVVPERTLTDSRDGKPYKIRKLADGRVWMVDNLRLVGPITATNLNSNNTNVAPGSTFALTASNSGTWCTTNSSACDNQSMVLDSGNADYGAYYNWYAATAGTGKYETTTDTSYSICPKGWRLPKGGSSGEFQALYDAGYKTSALAGANTPPNFALSGYRSGSSSGNQDYFGFYWSSTAYNADYAYFLYFGSGGRVYPAVGDRNKYYGFAVRCIAENSNN